MEILNNYIHATNTHDFNQVRKLLHPDAVYFFSNQTCKGDKEIQQYFENAWATVKDENYEAHDVTGYLKVVTQPLVSIHTSMKAISMESTPVEKEEQRMFLLKNPMNGY